MNRSHKFDLAMMALIVLIYAACVRGQDVAIDAAQGDLTQAQNAELIEPLPTQEQFVPRDMSDLSQAAANMQTFGRGTIVLRPDATISDDVIHVKNVCRWSETDASAFAPVADLAIAHVPAGEMYATVTLDQIRQTLSGAGVNMALVTFGGSASCAVNRTDPQDDQAAIMQKWVDAHPAIAAAATQGPATPATDSSAPAAPPMAPVEAAAMTAPDSTTAFRTLRSILTADLAGRLQIDPENLEISFNSSDNKELNFAEPFFQFEVTPRRVQSLGDVSWDVVVVVNGHRQKYTIDANARQWLLETVMVKPIAYQQVIRAGDVQEKRVLTDQMPVQAPLAKAQAIGQQASRELKPGTVVTADMVDPVLLVRPGQLVTVNISRGTIKITAVATSMDSGSFGQTIRARNDVDPTKIFEVMMTGPQEGTVTSDPDDKNPSPVAAAAN